jgi:hypothetical protein
MNNKGFQVQQHLTVKGKNYNFYFIFQLHNPLRFIKFCSDVHIGYGASPHGQLRLTTHSWRLSKYTRELQSHWIKSRLLRHSYIYCLAFMNNLMTSTKLRKKKPFHFFHQINDSTNLSIKTDQCMEVIKSAIREASGQSLDLRRECGRVEGNVTDTQEKFCHTVTLVELGINRGLHLLALEPLDLAGQRYINLRCQKATFCYSTEFRGCYFGGGGGIEAMNTRPTARSLIVKSGVL